jgi:hypothetical protein
MTHRFSHETNPVIERVANNHGSDDKRRANRPGHGERRTCNPLEKKGLRES